MFPLFQKVRAGTFPLLILFSCFWGSQPLYAAVTDVTITDVTTHAFSVVWMSDEPVTDATVHVFSDADGLNEIPNLSVNLISSSFPPALDLGIVKVGISGLPSATEFFIQTETTNTTGTEKFPDGITLLQFKTANATTRENDDGSPIINDLIKFEIFKQDGTTPATGALMLFQVPTVSKYPLSAFVNDGFELPTAVIDLNNTFSKHTGMSIEVPGNEVALITEFRGLNCASADHKLTHFRKLPEHSETPLITELESPVNCFFADIVCDNIIDILDIQRLLNIFNESHGSCAFNPDLDVVKNDQIDILDLQSILNRFGEKSPFE